MVIVSKLNTLAIREQIKKEKELEPSQEEVERILSQRKEGELVMQDIEFMTRSRRARYGFYLDANLKYSFDNYLIKAIAEKWDAAIMITGIEGCLSGDTKIMTSKGNKKIKDINSKNIIVKALDIKKNKVVNAHATITKTGTKEVFKIKTKKGNTVEATEEHRFFVKEKGKIKEKRVYELKKGDKLLCVK